MENQREQQVELLLHAERPGVGEGIICRLRTEIGVGIGCQHDIAEPDESEFGDARDAVAQPGVWDEQLRREDRREQHRDQRGHDPHQPARIEMGRERAEAREALAGERSGDDEPRDHEEDVDPGEPAGQRGWPEMVEDHRDHGDGAEPVDRRNIAEPRARLIACHTPSSRGAVSRAGAHGGQSRAAGVHLAIPRAARVIARTHRTGAMLVAMAFAAVPGARAQQATPVPAPTIMTLPGAERFQPAAVGAAAGEADADACTVRDADSPAALVANAVPRRRDAGRSLSRHARADTNAVRDADQHAGTDLLAHVGRCEAGRIADSDADPATHASRTADMAMGGRVHGVAGDRWRGRGSSATPPRRNRRSRGRDRAGIFPRRSGVAAGVSPYQSVPGESRGPGSTDSQLDPGFRRETDSVSPSPFDPIAFDIRPVHLDLGAEGAMLEFEMILANASGAMLEGLRVSLALASTSPAQDAMIAAFHGGPLGALAGPPVDLAPGQGGRIPARLALPRDQFHVVTVGDRPMFVPMVLVELRWRSALSVRRQGADFMVGTAAQSGKLGPIWLDRGPPRRAGLAARPLFRARGRVTRKGRPVAGPPLHCLHEI
ncbi:MAG: hypothetical protein WDN44_13560 [Sphingomonas sp.]